MTKPRSAFIVLAVASALAYGFFRWWVYEFYKFIDGMPTEENP